MGVGNVVSDRFPLCHDQLLVVIARHSTPVQMVYNATDPFKYQRELLPQLCQLFPQT
jgi:hypothetical protein